MPWINHRVHGSVLVFGYGDVIIDPQNAALKEEILVEGNHSAQEVELYGLTFKITNSGAVGRKISSCDEELDIIPIVFMFKNPESVDVLIQSLNGVRDQLQRMRSVHQEPSRLESGADLEKLLRE